MKRLLALLALAISVPLANATPISDKYAQLGGAGGFLGAPTIPETTAPDGVGKFRHYQHGSIYWHPECGAREVHGLIRERWAQLGWEQSYLGYPITDEIDLVDGSGRVSRFKGGELIWRSATNQVSEVKSTDLVVDLPFTVGEPWVIGQTNAVTPADSHSNQFAYCWDLNPAQGPSKGRPVVATATAKIVYVDENLASGDGDIGNVVIQRYGEGRYASYLHIASGSYTKEFAKQGTLFSPQAIPWSTRPVPNSGTTIADVGDTGTAVGNYHLHYCVTTTPDRKDRFVPFESVPVAFRNYSVSTNSGGSWTYVPVGVPRSGQWVRREQPKAGQQATAQVNASAVTVSHGTVKATVVAGDGKPTAPGKITITLSSAWGEPLKSQTRTISPNNLNGPWKFQFTDVPAFNGLKLAASYEGPWSLPHDAVNGESADFNLAPNAIANAPAVTLKTTLIK